MKVKCPACQRETEYTQENQFRPFCSERCKLIDLGQWAEGKYTIPVVDHSDIEDDQLDELSDESSESRASVDSDPSGDLH